LKIHSEFHTFQVLNLFIAILLEVFSEEYAQKKKFKTKKKTKMTLNAQVEKVC